MVNNSGCCSNDKMSLEFTERNLHALPTSDADTRTFSASIARQLALQPSTPVSVKLGGDTTFCRSIAPVILDSSLGPLRHHFHLKPTFSPFSAGDTSDTVFGGI